MNPPTLSVVMPNYNHARYLPRSLAALLNQSVQPLEIIVVDDASTDNSVDVIQEFARQHPLIRLHHNEKNMGVLYNIRLGLDMARGDYIFSPAADDEVTPGFFEKSLRLLAQHPQAALSCTIGDYREEATGLNWLWGAGIADQPCYLSPADLVKVERRGKLYIPPNSVIFKKSALREVGNYPSELKFCTDWYAMYVAGFRHGICFVPEPLAVFHVQSNSYYHRLRRDETEYAKVLAQLLQRLNQQEIQDAVERIRKAGSLFIYAMPMLKVMLSQPDYRRFITPTFLRKNLAHSAKLFLKNHSPAWFVKFYLQISGYRKR